MRKKELLNKNSTFVSLDLFVIFVYFLQNLPKYSYFSLLVRQTLLKFLFVLLPSALIILLCSRSELLDYIVRAFWYSLPSEPLYAEFLFPESCVKNVMPTLKKNLDTISWTIVNLKQFKTI